MSELFSEPQVVTPSPSEQALIMEAEPLPSQIVEEQKQSGNPRVVKLQTPSYIYWRIDFLKNFKAETGRTPSKQEVSQAWAAFKAENGL